MNSSLNTKMSIALFFVCTVLLVACKTAKTTNQQTNTTSQNKDTAGKPRPISKPLVSHIYTADPSAHVFDNRIYIYPSHDIETSVPEDDLGSHFDMKDYHILSMDNINGPMKDHGVALDIKDVPCASKQM